MPVMMNVLGINIRLVSYDEMLGIYDGWLAHKEDRSHSVALINVQTCVSALLDKGLRDLYNEVDLAGCDSMPFLYWARLFYRRSADRLYAPDIMLEVSKRAKARGYTYYLYGGYPGAPEKIEDYLRQRYRGIAFAGEFSPPFRALSPAEDAGLCESVNQLRPDFVWVGLGSPKQDVWIREHRERIRGAIFVASGATFDFFSGRIRQAPRWIRDAGLEWLFRLTQDFRRLWTRYTIKNIIFLFFFALQLLHIVSFDYQGYLCLFGRRTSFWNT